MLTWVWARHGNTFGPADSVVYVGKRNDLPLVAHGIEQAHRLADAWLAFGVPPVAIYCGTLLRLQQTAHIVCSRLGWPSDKVTCDARLDELDYGGWTGLSRNQVVAQFGEASVLAWETRCVWPAQAGWGPGPEQVRQELAEWMDEARARYGQHGQQGRERRPVLVVSSNGRLRYALSGVPGAFEAHLLAQNLKVRTGHVGVICVGPQGGRVLTWDAPPAVALSCLPELCLADST